MVGAEDRWLAEFARPEDSVTDGPRR